MKCKYLSTVLAAVLAAVPFVVDAANAWMQNARTSPEWFTRGVMYQIQPRAFTPEGTLKAAEKKLAYLKDLGVTIAYLVPVMKMDADGDRSFWSPRQIKSGFDNPKNQYRIADYFHVDEEYGTDQDLKDFCAEAHRLGMKVVFDLVYFHCGPTAPFLREHPEFTWWNPDGTVKKGPWRFPKLNFAEPKLREYLIGNIRHLIQAFGADGFRCDVGDGIPLDFWCDAHDMMDGLTGGNAVLLCEGFTVCDQYKGFDADYGWFPGLSAASVRGKWTGRAAQCPVGSKFVNHYENHDIATDARPRREEAWGHAAVDQVLVWMFTLDGVPMLFTGNEIADADKRHSMFGKTPMDWSQLDREPGKSRHALVKRLAALRREHPAFTDVNGTDGLTWLDTTAKDAVTAFVRRNGRETVLVVQNWTKKPVKCGVSFTVPKRATASYLAPDETDRDVKGTIAPEPLFARDASYSPDGGFTIGPFGWWISKVGADRLAPACQRDGFTAYSMLTRDGRRMVSYVDGTNTVYELVPTNRLPANLPPVREWKFYGLKATHTDIGLHNSQYIQRHGTVKRIDQAARLVDADTRADDDPAAYRYVMEGAWFWDNYHQDKGMDAAWRIVTNYMARGRMDVGVTCAGNHTHLFSETEIDRSTLTKKYLADTWGIGTKTFLMADNPGISCSVIAPYVRAGIKYGLFLPNHWNPIPSTIWKKNTDIMSATWNPDAMGGGARVEVSYDSPLPMVFRWKAPGGDESLLMWCSTQYGYGYSRLGLQPGNENRSTVASVEARMPSFLQILERKYPYDVWLGATYSDDETPNTKFADLAAAWNEKWAWPQFRTIGRLDEPFEYLEKNFGDKIPTLTGEMTSGWLQHAASTPELLADKLNADRMLETAERLGTFAGTIDRAAVDRAWWYLILNDEHSYGTSGYKGRRVFETWMQHRDWIERAAATASNELAKAVAKLGLSPHSVPEVSVVSDVPATPCRNGLTENRWYRVVVTNGVIYSIYDKELGRELLDGPANRFLYTRDNHKTWEANPEAALGAEVTRRVFLPSDAKRIDIEDRFEHARDLFNSRRYYRYGYLAFPFAVPDGVFAAHLNGTVIRPYEDCHPMSSDAYCAVRDWCAVENDAFGVALMMRDSTLAEFGEIHPDKTCYTGRPPRGKTAIYPYIFTDWLQMHQPDGDSMNFTFRFAITSYAGGWKAADVPRTCAAWLDPYAEWMRAHNVPHVARDAVAEPPPGWTGLIEKPRAGHGEKDGQMYVLWGAEMSPDFSHYELWRDGTFLAIVTNEVPDGIPYRVARYEDLGLPTHSRHEYRIRKVWKDGRKDALGAPFFGLTRFVSGIEAAPIKIRVGAGTPNATIDAALEKVAAIRRKDTKTPIEVRIAPGDYAMDRQLMITRMHANTNWAELTVRADDFGRKPRLFGARDVKGWTKVRFNGRDDVWMADVSALKLGKTSRLFFLDGRRMQPARWPNAVSGEPYGGCARALDDGIQMWQSPRFCNMGVYIDEIRFRPGEARSWSNPEYGWVVAWPRHNWWNAVYSIKCVSNDLVRLDAPHDEIRDRLYPWDRWRAENILEELDVPGEWYHDIAEHRLYFIPPGGIDPNAARTTVAHGAAVLSIAGGNVAIEGLEILNGAGGLNISSADRVRVFGCSIHDVGFFRESAVCVRGHHVRIEDCDVFNTGGNGIFLGSYGKECRVDDRMDVVIENNHVHHCGEVYSHGIGIWITGQGVRVSHNLIHDMPRCGLFGYGRFNEISYNRIRQVNLVNDDTGAIYGSGWTDGVGTKVCYNHISHSIGYQRTRDGSYVTHSGAHGIYPDEGCGGLEIFGNLVDHCNGAGALLHNGRWITISNNVFVSNAPRASAKGGGGQLSLSSWNNLTNDYFVCHRREAIAKQYHGLVDNDPRWLSFPSLAQAPDKDSTAFNADGSTMMGVRVVNNIFYYPDQGKTDLVRGRRHFSIPDNPFDRNVYWSGNSTNITFKIGKGYDWKTWREAGQDADSVLADPMFVNPANGDYRLRPGSPALARGFKEIPYAEIGLRRTKFRKELR